MKINSAGCKNPNIVKMAISGFSVSENPLQKYSQYSLKTSQYCRKQFKKCFLEHLRFDNNYEDNLRSRSRNLEAKKSDKLMYHFFHAITFLPLHSCLSLREHLKSTFVQGGGGSNFLWQHLYCFTGNRRSKNRRI